MIQLRNIQTFSNFQIKEFEKVLFIEHKSFTQPSFVIHQGTAHSSGESPQYILMIKLTVLYNTLLFLGPSESDDCFFISFSEDPHAWRRLPRGTALFLDLEQIQVSSPLSIHSQIKF